MKVLNRFVNSVWYITTGKATNCRLNSKNAFPGKGSHPENKELLLHHTQKSGPHTHFEVKQLKPYSLQVRYGKKQTTQNIAISSHEYLTC